MSNGIEQIQKGCDFKTEKKKKAMEKLKEVSRLAMAEEYNCKPHELDEIIEWSVR